MTYQQIPTSPAARRIFLPSLLLFAAMPAEATCRELAEHLDVGAEYAVDLLRNVSGGLGHGDSGIGELEIVAEVDGGIIGWEGAGLTVAAQYHHGRSLSEWYVGDVQGVSNLEATHGLYIAEAFLSFPVIGDSITAMAGLIDVNGIFDARPDGNLFLNSSQEMGPDFSQSGFDGPSLTPLTSMGAVVQFNAPSWTASLGVFDEPEVDPSRPDRRPIRMPGEGKVLVIGQIDYELLPDVTWAVGAWRYSGRFDALLSTDPTARRHGHGIYTMLQTSREPDGDEGVWNGWIRLGWANEGVHPIQYYAGSGVHYTWGQNQLGMAIAHARSGKAARAQASLDSLLFEKAETSMEVTFAHTLLDKLTLQPALQYIVNPGWDASLNNALVVGMRVRLSIL